MAFVAWLFLAYCAHTVFRSLPWLQQPFHSGRYLGEMFLTPLWGGVNLFFVLSGFLITDILLQSKTANNYFSSFYARRILRIFPVYYLVLVCSLLVGHFSIALAAQLPPSLSWRSAYFIYLQNWPVFWHGYKTEGGVWGAYWSLAVEEKFYFIWPIMVLHMSEKTITRICWLGLVCALLLRIYLYNHYFGSNFGLLQITSSRVDGLFAGAALSIYMYKHKRPVPMRWIKALAALGFAVIGYIALFHIVDLVFIGNLTSTFGITSFALLSVALVSASQHHFPFLQRILTLSGYGLRESTLWDIHLPPVSLSRSSRVLLTLRFVDSLEFSGKSSTSSRRNGSCVPFRKAEL